MSDTYVLEVPGRHYARLLTMLGDLMSREDTDLDTTSPAAVAEGSDDRQTELTPTGRIKATSRPPKDWTAEEIAELRKIIEDRPVLASLVELLAAAPGQAVTMTDFETSTGFTRTQLRSALAGLTQTVGKRYERSNWPFRGDFNVDESGEASYWMKADVAAMWTEAEAS